MTAPEKVKSGIEGLDRALSNIRLGDNVVWRLKSLDLFPLVAAPFVKRYPTGATSFTCALHRMKNSCPNNLASSATSSIPSRASTRSRSP